MEADGDPSVFNLNLKVLRPDDGVMMKLVKYAAVEDDSASDVPAPETTNAEIVHNHALNPVTQE